jgi:hypothetical protein
MIANNYIRHPETLRFQRELFHNGYKNQPRIMRAMECIFKFAPDIPGWVKEAARKARLLVKAWTAAQIVLNFKMPKKEKTLADHISSVRWNPDLTVETADWSWGDKDARWINNGGHYRSYCKAHQGGFQNWAKALKHTKNYSVNS